MRISNFFKNRIIVCLTLVIMIFCCTDHISARVCEYKYGKELIKIITEYESETTEPEQETETTEPEQEPDPTKITVRYELSDGLNKKYSPADESQHFFVDSTIFLTTEQCLKSINVCQYKKDNAPPWRDWFSWSHVDYHIGIFGSILDPKSEGGILAGEFDATNKRSLSDDGWFWNGEDRGCETVQYSGADKEQLKQSNNFITYCEVFNSLYSDIAVAYNEYGDCLHDENSNGLEKSRCKSYAITKVNKYTERLRATCNNILQNSKVDATDGCVQGCLGVSDSLKNIKKAYGLMFETLNECSVSGRLVIWISNIIKWVKYIIPVIVIVLSILDFIKAAGADKEDEIKKAQKKFIIRLISAILIFLTPIIIEFVLDKMGFKYTDCGIIDL